MQIKQRWLMKHQFLADDQVIPKKISDAPIANTMVIYSCPNTTPKKTANTGSKAYIIAARVKSINFCAHVCIINVNVVEQTPRYIKP